MATKYYTLKDGTKLCYNDTGEGRPVIIVHGWGENKRQWASYEKVISEAGYRYICPDQRASKDTEPSKTHPVTEGMLVDDIADLVEGLDLKDVTLIGHSLGVTEILNFCARYGNDRLRSIVLIDAPPSQPCDTEPGYEYGIWGNTITKEMLYKDCDWMDRDMHDYLSNWIKGSNPDINNAPDPDKAASDWATDYMSIFNFPDTQELYRSTVTFNQIGSVDKVKVPCLFMYPDHGDLVSPNMWMWYRDHMVCDYSAKGFDSASHFFCLEDDCIEESQKTILEFLANK